MNKFLLLFFSKKPQCHLWDKNLNLFGGIGNGYNAADLGSFWGLVSLYRREREKEGGRGPANSKSGGRDKLF